MISSLLVSLVFLFALAYQNWKRAQISEVKDLIPNCLLTSAPLVFMTGKRSLFYFLAYWNQIPHWLASHGYAVYHLPLPWSQSQKRIRALESFLRAKSDQDEKIHLFIDESSLEEMKGLLEKRNFDCLLSVTLVGSSEKIKSKSTLPLSLPIEEVQLPEQVGKSWVWAFHQIWTAQRASIAQLGWNLNRQQGALLLERAQFLAERDLLQRQRSPNL